MDGLRKIVFGEEAKQQVEVQEKVGIIYYHDLGFKEAGHHDGNFNSYKIYLTKIYSGYVERTKFLKRRTESEDKKIEIEISNIETGIKSLDSEINSLKNVEIKTIDNKIADIREEIKSIEENPESNLHLDKPDKFGYYLGISILVFLSIYLWIFYSSATYSAFFRVIDYTKNVVFNSIFYANSMAESLKIGFSAFLLTIVAPFIFIALGYLVHKFSEKKSFANYLKMSVLIFLTFVFDCIIAFEITKKIYDAESLNMFKERDSYGVSLAIQDVNFWLIIFAGFMVYIVWGLVLSFVSDAYRNFDKVNAALRKRKQLINEYKEQKSAFENKIGSLETQKTNRLGQIETLKKSIGIETFNRKEFEKIVSEFCSGWLKYMVNAKSSDESQKLIQEHTHTLLYNINRDFMPNATSVS